MIRGIVLTGATKGGGVGGIRERGVPPFPHALWSVR